MTDDLFEQLQKPEPRIRVAIPWERLETESEEAFLAFQTFRDSNPPRRVLGRQQAGVNTKKLFEWYREFHWRDRAAAWDRHLDDIRRDEYEAVWRQTAKEKATEHAKLLKDLGELAALEAQKYLEASKATEVHGLLRPAELVKLTEALVKLDRLIRDQMTGDESAAKEDMSKLTREELLDLERLQRKILVEEEGTEPRKLRRVGE